MVTDRLSFTSAGIKTDAVTVVISQKIIELFSEGLYSSPTKALEELVSNSFDANAHNVHVILSPNLRESDASIVVIDDGEGMDITGLKQHWVIGQSRRRAGFESPGRKPIGKFGIGKLATFVLANQLTHICKAGGKFYAATMDYRTIGREEEILNRETSREGVFDEKRILIPVRELTEDQTELIVKDWVSGSKSGYKALKLFGRNAVPTWTIAIMSDLKEMGKRVQINRLTWILSTAMPLRDDFKLFLNGDLIEPSKIDATIVQKWIIGTNITGDTLGEPCPEGMHVREDPSYPIDSIHRFGLSHDILGRVTGYAELYEEELTGGKSDRIERSNGFFVYVRDRMINTEDPGFGIERNLLRHGTFSRLRVVVYIDSLDEELRSSRESLRQDTPLRLAKEFLHSIFNLARKKQVDYEKSRTSEIIIASRLSAAPGSITRRPILAFAEQALKGEISPIYTEFPRNLTALEKEGFLREFSNRVDSEDGVFRKFEYDFLQSHNFVAKYDIGTDTFYLNLSHPFLASFYDELRNAKSGLPLEMFIVAEVLLEANLYYLGLSEEIIKEILVRRDELFRHLVRVSGRRNQYLISSDLINARNDDRELEVQMVAAFWAMGFDDPTHLGGGNKPDGTAAAYLSAIEGEGVRRYKVSLEAKSGGDVSAHRLDVLSIDKHMREYECDHTLVIGNEFQTKRGEDTDTVKQIKKVTKGTTRTITLMYIDDLARLIRLVPVKRIGLSELRELFKKCITPDDSKRWVDKIENKEPQKYPYEEILNAIWELSKNRKDEPIKYQAVSVYLERSEPRVLISEADVIKCCKAMQTMTGGLLSAKESTVEIDRRPDHLINEIRQSIERYPDKERIGIKL